MNSEKLCHKIEVAGWLSVNATLVIVQVLLLCGCSTRNVRQGMYEGFRVRNNLQNTPSERIGKTDSPNYQDYERIKKERLEHEAGR